ncbi:MAG: bifunctional nuclease family protein [Spirochaetaceae bacterium]|jgi:bifunctional DNase/RNase|nr:bifunctional nuclease family protein [Spirochaetaceae bacterium]
MLEAEIWGIAETGDGYVVLIKPLESEFSVPVFIGQAEAHAILIGFGGVTVSRPLTIDLLHNLTKTADFKLICVEITELKDNTFYGRMVFSKPAGGRLTLDSRPSDALALAVRCKCPIYIAEKVVNEVGILAEDLTGSVQADQETQKRLLKAELDEVIAMENYERAAEIRDMLNLFENR